VLTAETTANILWTQTMQQHSLTPPDVGKLLTCFGQKVAQDMPMKGPAVYEVPIYSNPEVCHRFRLLRESCFSASHHKDTHHNLSVPKSYDVTSCVNWHSILRLLSFGSSGTSLAPFINLPVSLQHQPAALRDIRPNCMTASGPYSFEERRKRER
jgi:hypothetical protein